MTILINFKREPLPCSARIVLRSDYGIHADTKLISHDLAFFACYHLPKIGIYSAAMNVVGIKIFVGILIFFL